MVVELLKHIDFYFVLYYIISSRWSNEASLDFKVWGHFMGLVGLCNHILHKMVYRLLFYIGDAICIFYCPEGSGIPHIIACYWMLWLSTFHAFWESIYFPSAMPFHFPGSVFRLSYVCTYCIGILIWQINCVINSLSRDLYTDVMYRETKNGCCKNCNFYFTRICYHHPQIICQCNITSANGTMCEW